MPVALNLILGLLREQQGTDSILKKQPRRKGNYTMRLFQNYVPSSKRKEKYWILRVQRKGMRTGCGRAQKVFLEQMTRV